MSLFRILMMIISTQTYLVIHSTALEPQYLYHFCQNNSTFLPHSPYKSNLNNLLRNLSAQAAAGEVFYQLQANSSGKTVYGSYTCREYVDAESCGACVVTGAKDLTELCPLNKEAVIWYDSCMLRYANRPFFYELETFPTMYVANNGDNSSEKEFAEALREVMNYIFATEAENAAKSFLTKEINDVGGFGTMYCLMQCTPDMSGSDCTKCLRHAISELPLCCTGKRGGIVVSPSCIIRFEVKPFYQVPDKRSKKLEADTPSGLSTGVIASIIIGIIVAASVVVYFILCYRKQKRIRNQHDFQENNDDSLQYDLITIETATENFSQELKLGEGGFGEVYKGIFSSGQEIAVKRLSKSSGQGAEEFKTEVALVAKLQHRNLVRLLGYCLGGGETLLVYEFVPNKSLDYFLFDPEKRGLLDWLTRSKIIGGICRGILYLHEDSRLRVIHRDLKASNILLDEEMNPKISDFGMARMVGIDQTQGNTKRIVGTYGYMAPEYAMAGLYSVKSDVFSFGVLLLEILSGKKNSGFHLIIPGSSLLTFAWQLWNEGRVSELMDELLLDWCPQSEFVRYVHIGLLCVQEEAYNRPTMSTVVTMLTSESTSLPKAKRPAFSVGRLYDQSCNEGCSDNGLTISHFSPR